MKKVIFSFLTTGFMLTIIGGYALTPYAAEIPTESEVLATVTTKPATTDSTTNDLTVFKDSFSSDESDEGSFVYDFITANDNAFPTDTIFYEYNLVTELGNDGCWINFDLASGVFSMSGRDTQSFSIFGSFERKGNDLYLYPENASAEFYVLHRKDDHFVSQSEEKGVNLTEGLVFYADNDDFWEILPDQTSSENESNNINSTDLIEYNLVTELGNDGCWINFDLASGVFSMSGRDTQSFSIFGSFERKGNDLYLYPENASVEFYVLHREHDHFISKSEEKGVNLTEGHVFYADNDDFWEILPDQAPSENESTDTGDTTTTTSSAADTTATTVSATGTTASNVLDTTTTTASATGTPATTSTAPTTASETSQYLSTTSATSTTGSVASSTSSATEAGTSSTTSGASNTASGSFIVSSTSTSQTTVVSTTSKSGTTTTKTTPIHLADTDRGDVNAEGKVDAKDASMVLVAYAKVSTGSEDGLTEKQHKSADVNADGKVDAKDASFILSYYALVSTASGDIPTMKDFLTQKQP